MEADSRIVGPDSACQPIMRIDRTRARTLTHKYVSLIAWKMIENDI